MICLRGGPATDEVETGAVAGEVLICRRGEMYRYCPRADGSRLLHGICNSAGSSLNRSRLVLLRGPCRLGGTCSIVSGVGSHRCRKNCYDAKRL